MAKLVVAPIKAWAEEAWEAQLRGERSNLQEKAWRKQVPRIMQEAKQGIKRAWQAVRGPAGACWTAVTELGAACQTTWR